MHEFETQQTSDHQNNQISKFCCHAKFICFELFTNKYNSYYSSKLTYNVLSNTYLWNCRYCKAVDFESAIPLSLQYIIWQLHSQRFLEETMSKEKWQLYWHFSNENVIKIPRFIHPPPQKKTYLLLNYPQVSVPHGLTLHSDTVHNWVISSLITTQFNSDLY